MGWLYRLIQTENEEGAIDVDIREQVSIYQSNVASI
jgi:hypothetical protein